MGLIRPQFSPLLCFISFWSYLPSGSVCPLYFAMVKPGMVVKYKNQELIGKHQVFMCKNNNKSKWHTRGLVPIHPRVPILDPVFLRPDPKWWSKHRATDDCHFSLCLCKWCAGGINPGVRDFIVYFGGHLNVIKTSYTKYVKIYWPSTRSTVVVQIVKFTWCDRAERRFAVRTICKQLNSIRKRSHYIRLLWTDLLPKSRRTDHHGCFNRRMVSLPWFSGVF